MKRKCFVMALICSLAVGAAITSSNDTDDVLLSNVEALASGESGGTGYSVVEKPSPGDGGYGSTKCYCYGSGSKSCC